MLGRDQGGGKLFKYSVSNNVWSDFSVPSSIYETNSVLLTYCSKLLLISGKSMTVWEFSSNDFTFKQSYIQPVPLQDNFFTFIAVSKDEDITIVEERHLWRRTPTFILSIYDGRGWKVRPHEPNRPRLHLSGYRWEMVVGSHAIVVIECSTFGRNVIVRKAPIPSFGEDEDRFRDLDWENLEVISSIEFRTQICERNYSTILHDQQLYFVDPQGRIFMSFTRPPILPVLWGNSGVNFQRPPYMVGLPDGTMLMIGMVEHQDGSQLDIIKVSQKGNKLESRVYSILYNY